MTDRRLAGAFAGGLLVANSSPHLATFATGHQHLTPLVGRGASPRVNLAWGLANLVGGLALVRRSASGGRRWDRALVAFEAGCLTLAAWMAATESVTRINSGGRRA